MSNLTLSPTSKLAKLTIESLSSEEHLNALGSLSLSGYSASPLALGDAMAAHISTVLSHLDKDRPLDFLCAETRQLPATANADRYALHLRPWLWWLSLASNNRIFQNKAVPDIVKAIFTEHGFIDIKLALNASYTAREYCVQYAETDLAFVCRLLEAEGIFYFFTHEAGKHTLVLADNNDAFPPCPNAATIPFISQASGEREMGAIRDGHISLQAVSTGHSTSDYAFATPRTALYAQAQAASGPLNQYDAPGGYTDKGRGDELAKQRVQALRTQAKRFVGQSDCRWLVPGHTFKMTGHDSDEANIEWVLTSVSHEASPERYANRFEAIPKATPYRPARITPKPRMHSQSATVVGKADEEITTDQHGRVKIQFHWDRAGQRDESSSCWVRVAMPWAGNGMGVQFVPRIGQEVVVTFMDGDPDRPMVTGCVYNADNPPPFKLPDNATQSGIKTQSSKEGMGFNALRFEDKKDAEEVFLQAQKDFNLKVLNDATSTITRDETITLEKGQRTVNIKTGDDSLNVKGKRTVKVEGDQTHTTGGNHVHKVTGNYQIEVSGDLTIKVSGTLTLQSDGALSAKSSGEVSVQAATSLTNKAGTTLTNEAGTSLTSKASASQTVDGGGMLTLKGGVVMVN
jgi:type VI secretion system secreted protein VgrG